MRMSFFWLCVSCLTIDRPSFFPLRATTKTFHQQNQRRTIQKKTKIGLCGRWAVRLRRNGAAAGVVLQGERRRVPGCDLPAERLSARGRGAALGRRDVLAAEVLRPVPAQGGGRRGERRAHLGRRKSFSV